MITAERARELFAHNPEVGVLTWIAKTSKHSPVNIGDVAGAYSHGHLRVMVDGRSYQVHRLIWLMTYGVFPPADIDHINGVRDDNRLENLRAVTNQENSKNQKLFSTNTSGVVGVGWHKRYSKWQAYIEVNYKMIHLGYFELKPYAIAARAAAEIKYDFHVNHGRTV